MDPKHHAPVPPSGGASPATSVKLFQTLYAQLHRLAQRELRRNRFVTLGATTLLHEAYLDLSQRSAVFSRPRAIHGVCGARDARADHRLRAQRQRQKRGGQFEITSLDTDVAEPALPTNGQLARIAMRSTAGEASMRRWPRSST